MRALVTGATGFVGSHLVDALHGRGDEVTVLARSLHKAEALRSLGLRVVEGDLHTPEALERAAEGQDVIFHVAGMIAALDEATYVRANRDGTANLVAAAEGAGRPRFVLVSSMAAAGPASPGRPLAGSEPPRPVTAYGRSKLAAEQVVTSTGLPWTIVRPPTVYGPRDREVLKVFRLVRLGLAPVFGDGSQELTAIHGADLADALVAAGTAAAAAGRVYYACHPQVFTSTGFVKAVAAAMGRRAAVIPVPPGLGRALLAVTEAGARLAGAPTILTRDKANEFFQAAWTADPEPLACDTGWRARYDLESGLADTYRWYREAGWL